MLLTKDLIKDVEEKYISMLKMVNIPDFTKCISQFSGLDMDEVSDDAIKEYLLTWAKNKYRLFEMLGNKTKYDTTIEYEYVKNNLTKEFENLQKEFPAFTPWLRGFRYMSQNKITIPSLTGDIIGWLDSFENLTIGGMSVTRFFKHYLNAPDELVTKIARIFENDSIKANYTLSIDPVDMMLASETSYGWRSCYSLSRGDSSSHADGCIAALLDDTQAIAYVWDKEGKFELYKRYKFTSIRHKKMRQWVSISPSFKSIHFNALYPNESRCQEDLKKILREKVETVVAAHLGLENKWRQAEDAEINRDIYYGYSEFYEDNIYEHCSLEKGEFWNVYNEPYKCPCGCGRFLEASGDMEEDDDCMYSYNGEGFCCENFQKNEYCDYAGRYCQYACDCCYDCCCDCYAWQDAHPICGIDEDRICFDAVCDTRNGVVNCCDENCADCPVWRDYKEEMRAEEE